MTANVQQKANGTEANESNPTRTTRHAIAPRAARLLAISGMLSVVLLGMLAVPAAATGNCVSAGVDEAPWDNWIIVRACEPAVTVYSGPTACGNVGLVWYCYGENGTSQWSESVWIEHLP